MHPPSIIRLRLLAEHLPQGTLSYASIYQEKGGLIIQDLTTSPSVLDLPDSDALFAELCHRFDTKRAAIFVELVPFVAAIGAEVFEAVHEYLRDECPEMIYSPAEFAADWDRHVDALCALIPPIEHGDAPTASSLTAILNVGWAVLLTKLEQVGSAPADEDVPTSQMERLNELLLKAVELSEARRLWDECQ